MALIMTLKTIYKRINPELIFYLWVLIYHKSTRLWYPDNYPSEHNSKWIQFEMDTIPNTHDPEWAQSRMDTIPIGTTPNVHDPEWHHPKTFLGF